MRSVLLPVCADPVCRELKQVTQTEARVRDRMRVASSLTDGGNETAPVDPSYLRLLAEPVVKASSTSARLPSTPPHPAGPVPSGRKRFVKPVLNQTTVREMDESDLGSPLLLSDEEVQRRAAARLGLETVPASTADSHHRAAAAGASQVTAISGPSSASVTAHMARSDELWFEEWERELTLSL